MASGRFNAAYTRWRRSKTSDKCSMPRAMPLGLRNGRLAHCDTASRATLPCTLQKRCSARVWNGHTDSSMIFEHYRELVKPRDAQRYRKIRPVEEEKVGLRVARLKFTVPADSLTVYCPRAGSGL